MIPLIQATGNASRGDDGFGPAVLERLRPLRPAADLQHVPAATPEMVLEWQGRSLVILLDALQGPGKAGHLHLLDLRSGPAPAGAWPVTSHGFHPGTATELAGSLGMLPDKLLLLGAIGADFSRGAHLSPLLTACLDEAVPMILARLPPGPPGTEL